MVTIDNIEKIIKEIIRTDESIVVNYDSKLLCDEYENTKNTLKTLVDRKKELIESLTNTINEFFQIKPKSIFKVIKLNSFKLMPDIISFKLKFYLPQSVDKTSRQYYCYVSMMDKLVRQYDSISKEDDGYSILDITATLNIDELLKKK